MRRALLFVLALAFLAAPAMARSVNLDVHAGMEVLHAWAANGGAPPRVPLAHVLPARMAAGDFGGKSENMKFMRSLLNWLEYDDPANLRLILSRYAVEHMGMEIFPASHDQLNEATAGVALLVADVRRDAALRDQLVEWHRREFYLCRLMDAGGGEPWGPGARRGAEPSGSNPARTMAYGVASGALSPRLRQLDNRYNTGALALLKLRPELRQSLAAPPSAIGLMYELRVARLVPGGDYAAWFPGINSPPGIGAATREPTSDYVRAAGVENGVPWASATLDAETVRRIMRCGPGAAVIVRESRRDR